MTSALDWSRMCDVGLEVRKRTTEATRIEIDGKPSVWLSEDEATVLICAALEYANQLAHEHGNRLKAAEDGGDCGCSAEWANGRGCPAATCVRRKA